jgi:hypothetical protein
MKKQLIKKKLKVLLYRVLSITNFVNSSQLSQLLLINQYRQLANTEKLPNFQDTGFHIYSQTDEDGFLIYIFSLLGTTNKKVIEIGSGDCIECNSANLIINHGWQGLLFDSKENSINTGKKIYSFLKTTRNNPPKLISTWITSDNINQLITSNNFEGEIDLLSIDIDGNDYWIWKAIQCVNPRVIILEYNTYWMADESVTVPYNPQFKAQIINGAYYCGASLAAFVSLGKELGYRLVGSNTRQFNAFFVRNDLGIDILPEVTAESCLSSKKNSQSLNQYNFPAIKELSWEKV